MNYAIVDNGSDTDRVCVYPLHTPTTNIPNQLDDIRILVSGLESCHVAERVRDRINATRNRQRIQERIESGLPEYADEDNDGDDTED